MQTKSTWILTLLLAMVSQTIAHDCDQSNIVYHFTECRSGMRKAVFSWNDTACTNAPPAPLTNISCQTVCGAGTYLAVQNLSVVCLKCPENTYSEGGSFRLSSLDLNWDYVRKLPMRCGQSTKYVIWEEKACDAFVPFEDLSGIKINANEVREGATNTFEMSLFTYLVADGTVKFVYRKSATIARGKKNGKLELYVDSNTVFSDSELLSIEPQTVTIDLKKGFNELTWRYIFKANNNADFFLEILSIEVSPTEYTALECKKCKMGYSAPGSSQCMKCPANFYYNEQASACVQCPAGTFARPGDTKCQTKAKCNPIFDVVSEYGPCKDGYRNVTYHWPESGYCVGDNKELPPEKQIECERCAQGQYKTQNGTCAQCPSGYFSDTINAEKCKICEAGKYVPRIKEYEYMEDFLPEGFVTYCENTGKKYKDECYGYKGWVVGNNSFMARTDIQPGIRLVLRKNVNITERKGTLEFIYKGGSEEDVQDFLVVIDGIITEIPNAEEKESKMQLKLARGEHMIEWVYERTNSKETAPIEITFIRVKGEESDPQTCIPCPKGTFSLGIATTCLECPTGTTPNAFATVCEECPYGTYKDPLMPECAACPEHSYPAVNKTTCALYEAYNLNNEYFFNLHLFDSTTLGDQKVRKTGSFFGPIRSSDRSKVFFLSLQKPTRYDVDKYDFQLEENSLELGFAFGLFLMESEEVRKSPGNTSPLRQTQHRILKNLGSRLEELNIRGKKGGNRTVLEYSEGDYCDENTRYKTRVTLQCSKKTGGLSELVYIEDTEDYCVHEFVWRTPFACSQCKFNETTKIYGKCENGKRNIFFDEAENCILPQLKANLLVEHIYENETTEVHEVSEKMAEGEFVYKKEYSETCNEMEVSYVMLIIIGAVFVILIGVVIVSMVLSRGYKKRYKKFIEEKGEQKNLKGGDEEKGEKQQVIDDYL